MFIGMDLGTSAVKAVLWDGKKIVKGGGFDIDFIRCGDSVEIEPESYCKAVLQLIADLAEVATRPVKAIAMCAASGNTLIVDEKNQPAGNIISWLDLRQEDAPDENVRAIIGWPWCKGFTLAHLMRIYKETPSLLAPAYRVCMNNDYIQYLLCGRYALDYSSATPSYLMDQREFAYYKPYLEKVGITASQLSELVPCGTCIGSLLPEHSCGMLNTQTRIVSGSFDHPSAARACGVLTPEQLLISCGTSWVGFHPAKERVVKARLLNDPFMVHENGCWGEIISWSKIGLELEAWIVEHYGSDEERYLRFSDDSLAGGAGREKMLATVQTFKKMAFPDNDFSKVVMCGGPSESPAWRKCFADVWECDIEVSPYSKYTGAVGAAMLAEKAVGSENN